MRRIVVVGAGPTGLTIAEKLGGHGVQVILLDRNRNPGGCWRIDWCDGLMSEHSPKVVFSSQKYLRENLEKAGFDELAPAYGRDGANVLGALTRSFSLPDLVIVGVAILRNKVIPYRMSLSDWLESSRLSRDGVSLLRQISFALAQGPEMPASLVFDTMGPGAILDPPMSIIHQDDWMRSWAGRVASLPGVDYRSDVDVQKVYVDRGRVSGIMTTAGYIRTEEVVLAIPPLSLLSLLRESGLSSNWDCVLPVSTSRFLANSSYTGIGFQLYFDSAPVVGEKWWCRSCDSPWSIIALPVSDNWAWAIKDPSLSAAWSCVVVDLSVTVGGRYIHDMSPQEFVSEACAQLTEALGTRVSPKRWIVHANLAPNGNIARVQKDDAFGITPLGALPLKGATDGLWSVGPHNFAEVATIDRAIESGSRFAEGLGSTQA